MGSRRLLGLVVLFVALFTTAGHACALPLDTHAVADDGHGHEGHRIHAASCASLPSTFVSIASPHVSAVAIGAPAAADACPTDLLRRPADAPLVVRGSPPLYLRHSALLI